jgi:hypothetical protein
MALVTLSWVSGVIARIPRTTFETVDFDTPARLATSSIVGGLPAG